MQKLGTHILVELSGCPGCILNDTTAIDKAMTDAAIASEATILSKHFHMFQPQGVSGVVVIAESHLTIHTWPEYGYAAIDIFTCGDRCSPYDAAELMSQGLDSSRMEIREYVRGF